ncbi:PREDICTED: uncharacterized protein LOC108578055 [Habropoda laboriosa]|uniref:uncharacterized protein LOC108578055 n=1 Tax=Habropoda laboriosa TaxID=597456 RepID=UPI00083E0E75|nr:PREDICTED: uncharacterized protein LOC108578055 [Habropoda laboriosa]
MYFPLITILSIIICACQVLSQANTYEYSDQYPWSLVYTLYPFYNSETLLEVWKGDKTVDISTNVVTLAPHEQEQTILYSDDVQHNGTSLKSQDNSPYFLTEAKNINEEQLSKNRQRLSNYRNRHKDTSLQNE